MCRRLFLLVLVVSPLLAPARDKPENWIDVRSPHFSVISNADEKQARGVALQFERMRSVFHTLFPKIPIDTLGSITVLAIKDEKDFRALEPPAYLANGQVKLGGVFLRGADKNYVLMRLGAEGEHPYAVVYHEYTHLLLSKSDWMPLWLNEGLAEFYQNTDIREKEIALGQASPENLRLLRDNRLLPLPTLFAVDHGSPYYHDENKGSIFYAESWALTHYLEQNFRGKSNPLADYEQLLTQNVDAITAATRAFGDLKQLQTTLEGYVRQPTFRYLRIPAATDVEKAAFQVHALAAPQVDAVQADFLAYDERTVDARTILDRVLREDPNNVLAHETMGFLEFRERRMEVARNWYAQAVKLDSQSYLAHYYFAAISMNGPLDAPGEEAQVESSLRASIKLNPNFAPSYDRLAALLTMRNRSLEEAQSMALNAVQLEPGNLAYRLNAANALLHMKRGKDAVTMIRNAMHLASSPQETVMAETFLQHAEEYAQEQEEEEDSSEEVKAGRAAVEIAARVAQAETTAGAAALDAAVPNGPHHFVFGVLKNVLCNAPAIDLSVIAAGKTLGLHSGNYFKVDYLTLGFTLKQNLNPCADLEGRPAKVEYVDSGNKGPATVVAIEIHK